jgi:hypothetical protein
MRENLVQLTSRKQLSLGKVCVLFDQFIEDALHIGDIVAPQPRRPVRSKRLKEKLVMRN